MTQRTTSATAPSTPTTLEATRLYQEATPEQRVLLQQDQAACLEQGLEQPEYLEALEEWGGSTAEYLAEQGVEQDTVLEQEARQPDPDDTGRAAAEQLVATEQVALVQEHPAQDLGKLLAQNQQQVAEQEAQARAAVAAGLKALVACYRRGEAAYARGLLEAGGHAHAVIRGKLALGDKRKAGVQAVAASLAPYATDSVDANRLVRCWAAWQLLAVQPGLEKAAARVPYGHYRDAWCKLVERVQADTGEEHYVLLAGLEQECRTAFSQAVEGGLSKDACHERALALVREQGVRAEQVAKKAAHEAALAKAKADQEAAAKAKAQQQAEQQARAAEVKAQEALASEVQDEERVSQALEQAQAATQAAEEARKQREAADHAAQQKARDEVKAKQEALEASKRQAEAEAKAKAKQEALEASKRQAEAEAKVKADKQAKAKAAKQGDEQPATVKQPAPESKAGQNLLASAKAATAKDAGHMAAAIVRDHPEALDVLRALVLDLLDSPPKGITPEEVAQVSIRALGKYRQDMDPATQRALNAALLCLSKGLAGPAPELPAEEPAAETAAA